LAALGLLDLRVSWVCLALEGTRVWLDSEDHLDSLEFRVSLDRREMLDPMVPLVSLDQEVNQDLLDHRGRVVSQAL